MFAQFLHLMGTVRTDTGGVSVSDENRELCAELVKLFENRGTEDLWKLLQECEKGSRLRKALCRYLEVRWKLVRALQEIAYDLL